MFRVVCFAAQIALGSPPKLLSAASSRLRKVDQIFSEFHSDACTMSRDVSHSSMTDNYVSAQFAP